MKLVITEKPSVAMTIAKVIGAKKRYDGYLEGKGYIVSWCIGHLVEMVPPEGYGEIIGGGQREEDINKLKEIKTLMWSCINRFLII